MHSRNFIITLTLVVGLSPLFLFTEYFYPQTDVMTQIYPFMFETKRMLLSGAPWWTWQSFMGDNFIGSYAYYTFTRPLLLAVCLLPYKYLATGLAAYVYINFLILGFLSSYYFHIMGFDQKLRLIGSLLFTLSNYMICQLSYCMFFEPVQAFVILLICIEWFLHGHRFNKSALVLAGFVVTVANYYMMPASLIAGTMYFLCRVAVCYRNRWLSLTFKAAGCICLGLFMASILLIPVMMYLSGSPRTDSQDFSQWSGNWAIRTLSLIAPMPHESSIFLVDILTGNFLNMAYVGIFGIFAYILYASSHPHSWLTILCAIYIVCLVTPLNGIFNLFINYYYSRWCYALVMMLIVATLGYLKTKRGSKIPISKVRIYIVLTLFFISIAYSVTIFSGLFNSGIQFDYAWESHTATFILISLNTVALLLLTRFPVLSRKWTITCVTSIIVISILQCFQVLCRYSYAPAPFTKNNIYGLVKEMIDDRCDSDTFTTRNYYDPPEHQNFHLFSNRPSTASFISTINPTSAKLAFIIQHASLWYISPDRYHESATTLLSVKDYHTFGDYSFSNVSQAALRGDRYIPMGMAYDRYSLMEDSLANIERAKSHDILRGMLASLLIDKADEPELSRYMSPVEFRDSLPFDSLVAARRAYTCDSFKGDTHGFTATVSLPDTMVIMFSAAADPGFIATIDGKPSKIYNVNMGMSASIVPAGRHTIRYEYFPPGLKAGAIMSLLGLMIFLGLLVGEWRSYNRE